jgi:hypothetical protein
MRAVLFLAIFATLGGCGGCEDNPSASPCTSTGDGALRCAIENASDCEAVRDYPYARNLFCPAAFSAARTMVDGLADSLGATAPTKGFFSYYQTPADPTAPPDDRAQTTVACLDTPAPWGSHQVVGAGVPLCHLIAYVTSPGPTGMPGLHNANPVPDELRAFPAYFAGLSPLGAPSALSDFRAGSAFDRVVRTLGAAGRDGFLADYPSFAPDGLYDPAEWHLDPKYRGISGGGGGGWGGEIVIERADADPLVLVAFGGGGGGGMTSMRRGGITTSRVGAGGGGGVQFADGYRVGDRLFDGLGLGAGVGSEDDEVQYSYVDYEGSGRPPHGVHEFDPDVIADYQSQVANLMAQLETSLDAGDTVVLRGGGGMGGGAEYLAENGGELAPHALSTQAGFQFRYEFQRRPTETSTGGTLDAEQESAYAALGDLYRRATARAYEECGRDYTNFACMCPATHAIVIGRMESRLGDPAKVPTWLRQTHCPSDAVNDGDVAN